MQGLYYGYIKTGSPGNHDFFPYPLMADFHGVRLSPSGRSPVPVATTDLAAAQGRLFGNIKALFGQ